MHYAWNILDVWRKATPTQKNEGMTWYDSAHSLAKELDPTNTSRAAGIIAALSPMVNWSRNMEMAQFVYSNGHANGLGLRNNCRKAEAILAGNDPLDILGGDKVRAFYMTIADPANAELVVIDRHAFDIALGRIHTDADRKIGKKVYRVLSKAYVDAATIADVTPAQMQAVTWVTHRALKGIV